MRLILVRHGETDHNVARRIQGPLLDDPLNARGLAQAVALERRFADERARGLRLAAVYSSPLKRAWTTAEAVARGAGLPPSAVQPLTGMIEFSWGIYLGRLEAEILPAMHAIHERWEAGDVWHGPPEGESPASAWERARPGLEALVAKHAPTDETIVVSAHGRINRIILAMLVAQDLRRMEDYPQGNTAVTILESPPGALGVDAFAKPWRLVALNDKSHLDESGLAASGGSSAEGEPPLV